jgi:hypothetical protein
MSKETIILEPSYLNPAVLSENLTVNRVTQVLRRNVPGLPTNQKEQVMLVYGIVGFLRLYSGDYMIVVTDRRKVGKLLEDLGEIWQITQVEVLPLSTSFTHISMGQVSFRLSIVFFI